MGELEHAPARLAPTGNASSTSRTVSTPISAGRSPSTRRVESEQRRAGRVGHDDDPVTPGQRRPVEHASGVEELSDRPHPDDPGLLVERRGGRVGGSAGRTATTGLVRVRRRAMRANFRGFPNVSV